MNREKLEEWLKDISTPTGLSYSGDQTLSNSEVDTILEYVDNLQSKIDKAIEYIDKHFQDDEGIVCKITGEYEAERNENFIKELLDILKEDK